ncbi:hypothetical protein ABK040_007005 [Willaertia magna]
MGISQSNEGDEYSKQFKKLQSSRVYSNSVMLDLDKTNINSLQFITKSSDSLNSNTGTTITNNKSDTIKYPQDHPFFSLSTQRFEEIYYSIEIPNDWGIRTLQYQNQMISPQENNNCAKNSTKNSQKIFYSSFDHDVEKDFLEIYIIFTPNSIEKEAQLTIEDILNPVGSNGRLINPVLIKNITPINDKHIQPEKSALYFILQFQHELLPNKLLYKKVYFIQDKDGLVFCLMLTTTRRDGANPYVYYPTTYNNNSLQSSPNKMQLSPNTNSNVLLNGSNNNFLSTTPERVPKRKLSASLSISSASDSLENEDMPFRLTSNNSSPSSSNTVCNIDGNNWLDFLVRERLTVKSITELPRKTAEIDSNGIVLLSVPICFIPSLSLDAANYTLNDEIKRHLGIDDFGKGSSDFKLILFHPIQFLSKGKMSKEETVENIFITFIKLEVTENNYNNLLTNANEYLSNWLNDDKSILEHFYEDVFKKRISSYCSIVEERDFTVNVDKDEETITNEMNANHKLVAKRIELSTTTFGGQTLKKICVLVERKKHIWLFTYSSTNNFIAIDSFESILSEIKFKP